ncbi:response regulator [Phocaeicola paurosaccharolyticus]|jgi:two-component system, cell cycle response regulator DivK|uniref:response regulator n=1 Tax=Phocaeicola paurosaccharolyticus TaxID=732242 RepID=UPI0004696165|nr:response regulator [Phocaeicola paurosaccharolyticus]
MKKILVAEDTDSNFLLLSIILRKEYEVIRAANGEEAISKFKEVNPDMILMDIKMPIMDGLTATKEIRKIDTNIPIIALTANAYDSDKEKAYESGCNNYMAKPIMTNKLREMISSYFN